MNKLNQYTYRRGALLATLISVVASMPELALADAAMRLPAGTRRNPPPDWRKLPARDPEVVAWNAAVDARRAARKARRK